MITYRLAHMAYISDTSGTGARLFGGRWNPQGVPCIYTSEHLSLALLEKLVHAQELKDMQNLGLITFEIKQTERLYVVDETKLKKDWQEDIAYTQWLGGQIMETQAYLAFITPSVIIPSEKNIIFRLDAFDNDDFLINLPVPYNIDKRLVQKIPSQPGKNL